MGDRGFAELMQTHGLSQGGERLRPPAALRGSHVGAQLPDLVVFVTQDVDDVG